MATVFFSPVGNGQTFFNTQGQILAGGKIFTYQAGTTTPLATYTDNTGTVQNANPIILNSAGQCATEIWLTANTKFIIQDSLGNTIQTLDNIVAINNVSSSISEWIPSGLTPTYISATQFSVVGDQTLVFTTNRRVKAVVTAGTLYGSVTNAVLAVGVTTVTLVMDSGSLDSGLSSVSYGFTDPAHSSVQVNNNAFTGIPTAPTAANGTNTTQLSTTAFVQQATLSNKLPTIGCTQASGALTFTASPEAIDFRSTTLTSGTITTVYASPANLVLPSGGTLGAVTTVSARIVVVAINNAGTVELAIINLTGGNDLSETGVINTTSISASSTANNVFYSTTGRTGVAYRVIGEIDCVNTAGAWGNPTLVQGVGGMSLPGMPQFRILASAVTTSGTSVDFANIPSWVKRVTVMYNGVSTNGTSTLLIQLGTGGTPTTSGYASSSAQNGAGATSTAGFIINSASAANVLSGSVIISNFGANTWNSEGVIAIPAATATATVAGVVTLAGQMNIVRLTTTNGTDAFDLGSASLLVEG